MGRKQINANDEFLQLSRVYGNDFVQLVVRLRGVDVNRFIKIMAAGYLPGMALDTLVEASLYGMQKTELKI